MPHTAVALPVDPSVNPAPADEALPTAEEVERIRAIVDQRGRAAARKALGVSRETLALLEAGRRVKVNTMRYVRLVLARGV